MSLEEKVTPGTVNNLISFFEHHGDDSPPSSNKVQDDYKQKTEYYTKACKQDVVNNYFSATNGSTTTTKQCVESSEGREDTETSVTDMAEKFEEISYQDVPPVNGNFIHGQIEVQDEEDSYRETPASPLRSNGTALSPSPRENGDRHADYHSQSSAEGDDAPNREENYDNGDRYPENYDRYYEEVPDQQHSDIPFQLQCNEVDKAKLETQRESQGEYSKVEGVAFELQHQQVDKTKLESELEYSKEDVIPYQLNYQEVQTIQTETQHQSQNQQQQRYSYEEEEQRENLEDQLIASNDAQRSDDSPQLGFVYPTLEDGLAGILKDGNGQEPPVMDYAISYELLPNHLKGFTNPTVLPASYFNPEDDAAVLKKAMKGLGTDEAAIIEVLTNRSTEQRIQISVAYEKLFHKDLVQELKKELSGNFEDVIVGLMSSPYEFLARELKRAVKGAGTDEDTLIEILCIYDDQDINRIKEAYHQLFNASLKDDIYKDTSGDFRKILLSSLASCKEDPKASPACVAAQLGGTDAKGKSTLDADTLRTVLVSYTRPFLYNVFKEYETLSGKSFKDLIKTASSGDARNALMALYKGIVSVPSFFAEELQAAFKGIGTKDSKLIRIVVSRAEFDLEDIKESFSHLYGKLLSKEVQSETSGDYKIALLSLIEGCNKEDYGQSTEEAVESNL